MSIKKSDTKELLTIISTLAANEKPFKITFSKPRPHNHDVLNVYVKQVMIKDELKYSFTNRYKTKDEVKNYAAFQLKDALEHLMYNKFFNVVLFTQDKEYTLMQNKKGKSTLLAKGIQEPVAFDNHHDRQKQRLVKAQTNWLMDVGIAGADGKIFEKSQDKYRQINKYIEILDHLLLDLPKDKIINIADMGSGKGYLTFALYDHLVNQKQYRCRMTGYELREELVSACYSIAVKNGFVGLNFEMKNIEQANAAGCDVVIALHACDIATDLAIAKGIQENVKYIVVSPCCHKQVRTVMSSQNVLSPILKHGILEERQAELLTDGIRALILEAYGYKTQVFEFISLEHTSKNIMITAVKSGEPKIEAIKQVEAIKQLFGIEYHHLQRIMENWTNDIQKPSINLPNIELAKDLNNK
jgi:hypothetical protein